MHRPPLIAAAVLLLVLAACSATPASTPASTAPSGTPGALPSATEAPTPSQGGSDAPTTDPTSDPTSNPGPADELLAWSLTDVRSGETFTLAELAADGTPVLLEPMAVWCTTCRAQQQELITAHDLADFHSVSLDVDLSEAPQDLAAYADREGFDWSFAMADADLYRLLQERFGVAVTNPPSTPLIVIEPDLTVRALEFGTGVRSAEQVVAELDAG